MTFNARWAAKLAKQKAKEDARRERIAAKAKAAKEEDEAKEKMSKVNPFSTSSASAAGGMFGGNPFASPAPPAPATTKGSTATPQGDEEDEDEASDDDDDDSDDEFRLAEEMAIKASLNERKEQQQDDPWKQTAKRPYYKTPHYINTIPEPSSSSSAVDTKKASEKSTITELSDDDTMGTGGKVMGKEGYEKMFVSGLDPIFERFLDRVARSSSQLIRYEFGGEPIPFSNKGEAYKKLWKRKQTSTVPVEQFNDDAPGTCPVCGSKRVFELQLMPNVVNMLQPEKIQDVESEKDKAQGKKGSATAEDEETKRKREIERALGRSVGDPQKARDLAATGTHRSSDYPATQGDEASLKTGLTWSTVMVFVCEKDCCGPKDAQDTTEACVEELVEIMWEE